MSTSHCDYCADAWRAVLLALTRKGLRASVVARHYGLSVTTVVMTVKNGRKRGCLPPPTCRHCGVGIPSQRVVCGKQACESAQEAVNVRLRRARFGPTRKAERKPRGGLKEPHDVVWPELPPNPRERNPRVPRPLVGAPIRHVASLLGVGNKRRAEREAAVAAYLAGLPKPPPPPAPKPITPFRPLATPEPRGFWEATRTLRASGRKRPVGTYVVPPPLCSTIGTLPRGRIAA